MKEHLRELVAGADAAAARNRVREHLQVAILRSLQGAGAMLSLAFVGGTALRVLYRLPRFSEDLDSCLVHDKAYDLRRYLDAVLSDLKRQGYAPEVARLRDARTVQAAFVRFPDLLIELGVAQPRTKALAIRVEVDTNPPPGAVLETTLVRPRDVALRLQHHDPASQADLADPQEILGAPAVAGGIVGIAEDEGVGVVADAALEVLEVHRELAVLQAEG